MGTALFAAPISKEEAKQLATSFMQAKRFGQAVGGMRKQAAAQMPELTVAVEETAYHVFNVGQNEGFVIIGANDGEVLGYATEGTFDASNLPEQLQALLGVYSQVLSSPAYTYYNNKAPRKASVMSKRNIQPLVQTKWSQNKYYNNDCPTISGTKCPTGCVATAVAQVMYFNQWPTGWTKQIPAYTYTPYNSSGEALPQQTNKAKVPTQFQWDKMLLTYKDGGSTSAQDAVAELMAYVGASVKMVYNPGGSGAEISIIPEALNTYFDYDGGVKQVYRDDFSRDEWDDLLYSELANNRAIVYGGTSLSNITGLYGHCFVCDGYDADENMFHINWGWEGKSDGYFNLDVLSPRDKGTGSGSSEDGYSMVQTAVIGIQKNIGNPFNAEPATLTMCGMKLVGEAEMTRDNAAASFGDVSVNYYAANKVVRTVTYNCGLGLFKDGQLQQVLMQETATIPFDGYAGLNATGKAYDTKTFSLGNIAAGTYQIKAISKESSQTEWQENRKSDFFYINAEVTDTKLTLTVVNPVINLKVNSVELMGTQKTGDVQPIKVSVTNNGDKYTGSIMLVTKGSDGKNVYNTGTGIYIDNGETKDVIMHYKSYTAGKNHLYIYYLTADLEDEGQIWEGDVEFKSTAVSNGLTTTVNVKNTYSSSIYGNRFIADITVKASKAYEGEMKITLTTNNTDSYPSQSVLKELKLNAGESVTFTQEFSDLIYYDKSAKKGPKYQLQVAYDNAMAVYSSDYYTCEPGLGIWKADGTYSCDYASTYSGINIPADAVAVDLSQLTLSSSTSVTLSQNPNCIYYVGSTVPASLSGKNVVKNGEAEQITLDDSYAFDAPVAFTAAKISYKRVFKNIEAFYGKKAFYGTIVLPFAPTKVMNTDDNRELTWDMTSANDHRFWLKQFDSVDGTDIKFKASNEFLANVPYIVTVPCTKYDAEYVVQGKNVEFSAENVKIAPMKPMMKAGQTSFIGTWKPVTVQNVYANLNGKNFMLQESCTMAPFRAYFVLPAAAAGVRSYRIVDVDLDEPTAISEVTTADDGTVVYNLNGVRVAAPQKGIYVKNGKKLFIR